MGRQLEVLDADCPHCGTKNVAFYVLNETRADTRQGYIWDTFANCARCRRGILASFRTPDGEAPSTWLGFGRGEELVPIVSPSCANAAAPEHTLENVANFFGQGTDNLLGNWDAAGTMFRKALDVGLKIKFPEIGGTLYNRIQSAEEAGGLTPELAEWARQIRLDGNDAANDEDPFSEEDAQSLYTFTDLVLRYLFTLPGMLREAQCAIEDENVQ